MVGWHNYLPQKSRLSWVSWPSLESAIFALGRDPARLTDLAIQQLGLESVLDSVVILSKLGNGATGLIAKGSRSRSGRTGCTDGNGSNRDSLESSQRRISLNYS